VQNLTNIEQTDVVISIGTFDETLEILDARLANIYQTAGVI